MLYSVLIPQSLSGSEQWPEVPSTFTQAEARIRALNTHPPVPGENGCWMLWNLETEEYVASQLPLPPVEVGPQGEKGEQGDPGPQGEKGDSGVVTFNRRNGEVKPEAGDYTPDMVGAISSTQKGAPGGVAELDNSGVVPVAQMPGYFRSSGGNAMGIACVGGPLKLVNIRGNTVLGGTPAYDAPVSMASVESPIRLHVVGKNLVDLSGASVTITSFGVTCTADAAAGTMTLSGTCDRPGNNSFLMPFGSDKSRALYLPAGTYYLSGLQSDYDANGLRLYINCYNSANQSVGSYGTNTTAGTTFTLAEGAWCTVNVRVPDGMNTDGIVIYPQIEAGTEKTAFEPYQGEVVEVPLLGTDGQELEPLRMAYTGTSASSKTAWHDRIVRKDGLWCVMRSAVERDLTDAVWSVNANYALPTLGGRQIKDGATSYFILSTHFASRGENGNVQDDGIWFGTSLAVGNQVLPNGADTTAEEMGQWCAAQAEEGTPVRVCYVLAQPVYEALHQGVQALLNTLAVPGGVCSVWFEGEVLPSGADIGLPRGDYPSATATSACKLIGQHMSDQENPHGVTAEQAGADPAGSAAAVQQALSAHMEDKDNPHAVDASQILFADGESLQHKQENGTLSPGGIRLGTAAISMPLNPARAVYRCIAFGGGKYVALSRYFAAVSETGADWQMAETGFDDEPNAVAYGDGRFIAVCENGAIYKSADGLTWAPMQDQNDTPLADVVYHDGKWVAVGMDSILFSGDGDNWSEVHVGAELYAVTCGNGRFLAVGYHTSLYSDDGQSWTECDSDIRFLAAYGNGRFVAATGNGMVYSTDCTVWNMSEDSFGELKGLEFGEDIFIASDDTASYYSADGIHWTQAAGATGWTDAAYKNGRFLALSRNNQELLLSSVDGTAWTQSVRVLLDEAGADVTRDVAALLGM